MKRKKYYIRQGLSLLILLFCMTGHFLLTEESEKLPEGTEISGEEEIPLTADQMKRLEDDERYGFAVKKLLRIESILVNGDFSGKEFPDRQIYAEGWYTDSGYGETCHLKMADGSYFLVNPVSELCQDVVISDVLAEQLFFRTDAAGETIQIAGKEYRICGVYEKNRTLPARMSESRFERIYLPYTAYPAEDGSYPIRFFYDRRENQARFTQKITGQLEEKLEMSLPAMQVIDFAEYRELIRQTFRLAVFFVGMLMEFGMFAKIWRFAFERKIGYIALLLAAMAVIGRLMVFSITIPAGYLPGENIFDLSCYLDALVASRQSQNSRMIYSMYQGYAGRMLGIGAGYLAVEVMGWTQAYFLGR